MHPWLLHSPPIATYGTCIVLAAIAAWLLARHQARRAGLPPARIDLLIPLLMATGIAGAWVFGQWTDRLTDADVGGAVLMGALAAGTASGIVYALLDHIPLGVMGDIFAAPMALAIAGGRLGCFFAGCCYGKPCTAFPAIHFPAGSPAFDDQLAHGLLDVHAAQSLGVWPVQLFESAGCALLTILLLLLCRCGNRSPMGTAAEREVGGRGRGGVSGEAFLTFVIGYSFLRFGLEFLRADNPPVFGHLTFSQCAAVLATAAAGATILLRRHFASRWRLGPILLMPPDRFSTSILAPSPG